MVAVRDPGGVISCQLLPASEDQYSRLLNNNHPASAVTGRKPQIPDDWMGFESAGPEVDEGENWPPPMLIRTEPNNRMTGRAFHARKSNDRCMFRPGSAGILEN